MPAKSTAAKIVLRVGGRLLLVEQRDICFASIEEGTISVATHSIEGQSNCRTLEDLLELLDPKLFWRAHRSFVVNIHRIQEVVPWFKSSYQLRMDDRRHSEIPVSRGQTKRLREIVQSLTGPGSIVPLEENLLAVPTQFFQLSLDWLPPFRSGHRYKRASAGMPLIAGQSIERPSSSCFLTCI